jgi:hypothetical protein
MGLIVAAYSNDEMAYIPAAHMLPEGGHEADNSMYVYGNPWDARIESSVKNVIVQVMRNVAAASPQPVR